MYQELIIYIYIYVYIYTHRLEKYIFLPCIENTGENLLALKRYKTDAHLARILSNMTKGKFQKMFSH